MSIRIVVADERQANFFDATSATSPLADRGSLINAAAGLRDSDLETDRPGRRYGGTAGVSHGNGHAGSHHHAVDGERSTEQHDIELFTKEVARRIDKDRANNEFDSLVLIAPPKLIGLLRKTLPPQSQSMLVTEITKDILQYGTAAIVKALPPEIFSRMH